jgi:hypothetical protein
LSQYLQRYLDRVGTNKHSNHQLRTYLYGDRGNSDSYRDLVQRDGKYCAPDKSGQAILVCHRDSFTAQKRDKNPAGCTSNATLQAGSKLKLPIRQFLNAWPSQLSCRYVQPILQDPDKILSK